eukprot:1142588-Prymnesium_polylepis.1
MPQRRSSRAALPARLHRKMTLLYVCKKGTRVEECKRGENKVRNCARVRNCVLGSDGAVQASRR